MLVNESVVNSSNFQENESPSDAEWQVRTHTHQGFSHQKLLLNVVGLEVYCKQSSMVSPTQVI